MKEALISCVALPISQISSQLALRQVSGELQLSPKQETLLDMPGRMSCAAADEPDAHSDRPARSAALPRRLELLTDSLLRLLADPVQDIDFELSVQPGCPVQQEETVLWVAYAMISNAIKHGMADRLQGKIMISLTVDHQFTRLAVSDDGKGLGALTECGHGMQLMYDLASRHGGGIVLRRRDGLTRCEMTLPKPKRI